MRRFYLLLMVVGRLKNLQHQQRPALTPANVDLLDRACESAAERKRSHSDVIHQTLNPAAAKPEKVYS